MSYSFSKFSIAKLRMAHPDLQLICHKAIEVIDFSVLYTWRSKDEQNDLFKRGFSKLEWPKSKHNTPDNIPQMVRAVDLAPFPYSDANNVRNIGRFYFLAGIIMAIAHKEGVRIRFGGDWDMDNDFRDENFHDLFHFELL